MTSPATTQQAQTSSLNTPNTQTVKLSAMSILKRHGAMLCTVLALLSLLYAVWAVNEALQQTTINQAPQDATYNTSFDQKTIDTIKSLRTSNDPGSITLPDGRINPFAE